MVHVDPTPSVVRRLLLPHRLAGTRVATILFFLGLAAPAVLATNFLVVNAADSGPGSLRAAVEAANLDAAGAPHQISFNVPAIGVHTITLLTPLPDLFVSATIDGFTQPGAVANSLAIGNDAVVLVEIDGSNLPPSTSGLVLRGDDSVVRGLVINGLLGDFSAAVLLRGARGVVEGCFLGTDPTGTVAIGNGEGVADIGIIGGHRVGGPLPAQRNLISGHRNRAIVLAGPDVVIQGNYVGTDRTGTVPLTPDGTGAFIFAGGNATGANALIGGPNPGEGPTRNDPLDADDGTNRLQNSPTLDQSTDNGATFRFAGSLESAANSDYRIELFSNRACHPSGFGEARTFLGFVDVATDGAGLAPFVVDLPAPPPGERAFTATATDIDGNTSELSSCLDELAEIPALDATGVAALAAALCLVACWVLRRRPTLTFDA